MKCFRHPQADAVCICKHCAKGACSECAIDAPAGVACSTACAERIAKLDEMVQSANAASRMNRRGAAYFQPAFLLVPGMAFLAHAIWFSAPGRSGFGIMFGGLLFLFGIGLGAIQFIWHRRSGPMSQD